MGTGRHRYSELWSPEQVQRTLTLSDEQLRAVHPPAEPGRALTLKKYTLPFLTSRMSSLSLFSPDFQRLALELRAKLDMFNEDIDAIWFYLTKTFDASQSVRNYDTLQSNMRQLLPLMARSAREIADDITDLLARRK